MEGTMYLEEWIQAAENGNSEKIVGGLTEGFKVDAIDGWGQTALMKAAMNAHLNVISLLLKAGADINRISSIGWTPLCFAATRDHFDTVDVLIKAGADVNTICQDNCTILEWVIRQQQQRESMCKYLLDRGAIIRPKTFLIAENNRETGIASLLETYSKKKS
jgi:hypothetical protein